MSRQQKLGASSDSPSGEEDNLTGPTDQTPPTSERGDASAHGFCFWQRGRTAIFDVHITDTQSRSYRNEDYQKVLAQQEKEKKNQYLCPCLELEMRKDFTPIVYSDSVDGMASQGERLRMRRSISRTIFRRSGTNNSPIWCIIFGSEWPLSWYAQSDPWQQQGPATSPPPCYL